MVSPLKKYSKDPMSPQLNRGAGLYYKRSHGGTKEWYSKYEEDRDYAIKTKKNANVYQSVNYRHAGDKPGSIYTIVDEKTGMKKKWVSEKKNI